MDTVVSKTLPRRAKPVPHRPRLSSVIGLILTNGRFVDPEGEERLAFEAHRRGATCFVAETSHATFADNHVQLFENRLGKLRLLPPPDFIIPRFGDAPDDDDLNIYEILTNAGAAPVNRPEALRRTRPHQDRRQIHPVNSCELNVAMIAGCGSAEQPGSWNTIDALPPTEPIDLKKDEISITSRTVLSQGGVSPAPASASVWPAGGEFNILVVDGHAIPESVIPPHFPLPHGLRAVREVACSVAACFGLDIVRLQFVCSIAHGKATYRVQSASAAFPAAVMEKLWPQLSHATMCLDLVEKKLKAADAFKCEQL